MTDPCRVSIDEVAHDLEQMELLKREQEKRRRLREKHSKDWTLITEALEEVYTNPKLAERILTNFFGHQADNLHILNGMIARALHRRIEWDLNLGE